MSLHDWRQRVAESAPIIMAATIAILVSYVVVDPGLFTDGTDLGRVPVTPASADPQERMATAAEDQARYTKNAFAVLILTLFATAWAAIASSRAVRTANKTLVVSERPWVSISVGLTSGLEMRNGEIRIGLSYRMTNFGKSPATNVLVETKICGIAQAMDVLDEIAEQQLKQAVRPARRRRVLGSSIFPNEIIVEGINTLIERTAIETAIATGFPGRIIPAVVGCVRYRSSFDETLHQTGFIYDLVKGQHHVLRLDENYALIGGDVPQDELRLEQVFVSGFVH